MITISFKTSKNGIVGDDLALNSLDHPTVNYITGLQNKMLYGKCSKNDPVGTISNSLGPTYVSYIPKPTENRLTTLKQDGITDIQA